MPHERVYSLDSDPDHVNCAQVAWGHPSSPSNTGPGHGNEDGHVMIVVERPGTPARTPCSIEEVKRRLVGLLQDIRNYDAAASEERDDSELIEALALGEYGVDLSYAFGGQLELLAVTIDRKGCNKMINALRRGRDAAFGKDE